jgi:membrane protease YdiL (CAAX protease family)
MSTQPDDDTPEASDRSTRNMVVGLAIAIEGGLIALACLLGWLLDKPPLQKREFNLWAVLEGVAAAVPLLACFFLAVRWPVGPLRGIKDFTDRVIRPLMMTCSLIDLVGIALLAGLGEEMLFRGVLQETFRGPVGMWWAIVVAALLFGIIHAVTPSYAVLAAVDGAYLGVLFWLPEFFDEHHEGNLVVPIVAHAVYDFVALVYLTRGPGSDLPPEPEDEDESEQDDAEA